MSYAACCRQSPVPGCQATRPARSCAEAGCIIWALRQAGQAATQFERSYAQMQAALDWPPHDRMLRREQARRKGVG